ncbi:MAG: hypothetical protein K0R48_515 [Gammaproteobacteria bacterium]|jgi:hypothetical protein|nr:hypothetical protein [Gammaproteobacteria bacterium]
MVLITISEANCFGRILVSVFTASFCTSVLQIISCACNFGAVHLFSGQIIKRVALSGKANDRSFP